MRLELTQQQQAWLAAHVESGEFASYQDAICRLIDQRIAEDSDDLAWAASAVNIAKAAVERGETVELSEHKARNAARLAALGH